MGGKTRTRSGSEGVLGDEFVDQTTDHREQLKEAEGGDQKPRLGVVGLKCRDESLPMSQWFAKKGGDGGHNHILLLECELQSKADPVLVGSDGKLTNAQLNTRSKRIQTILFNDPERRPLSNPDHPFWVQVKEGEEDEGKQGNKGCTDRK